MKLAEERLKEAKGTGRHYLRYLELKQVVQELNELLP